MIDFARRLVATASPSGDEGAVIELCAAEMERLGYDLSRDPEGNLLGTVGRGDARLLFDVHADTVAPTAQGATIADGCLFGRGACDVKGPMAALTDPVDRPQPLRRGRILPPAPSCLPGGHLRAGPAVRRQPPATAAPVELVGRLDLATARTASGGGHAAVPSGA